MFPQWIRNRIWTITIQYLKFIKITCLASLYSVHWCIQTVTPGWKSRIWLHMISHVISWVKSHEFHALNHMNFTHLITWNPIWNHMRSYEDFGLRRCENVWVNKYKIIWANLYENVWVNKYEIIWAYLYLKYTNIHTSVRYKYFK